MKKVLIPMVLIGSVLAMGAGIGYSARHMGPVKIDLRHLNDFYQDLQDLDDGKRTDGAQLLADYENLPKNTYLYRGSPAKIIETLEKINIMVSGFKTKGSSCEERYGPFKDTESLDVRKFTYEGQRMPKKRKHASSGGSGSHKKAKHSHK
ncbi:hypothetical protein [Candidatus Hepatobacter penaei]|uniref:hypothetical protein n=1 Tax=Candidatus Hepatobacter penaei TaxID=1274402 RepID=UPI0012E06E73|nr:hypothetical protein [Candidatus Hepatobacter penaei]